MNTAEIGIFGGTGIYDSDLLSDVRQVSVQTPYGSTSSEITLGVFDGMNVAFLPRHGKKHSLAPHMINYRANVWAFKELGVQRIISPSAVGSLKLDIEPGHFAIPTQFIDNTKGRKTSFTSEGNVIHISVADPFCPQLQNVIYDISDTIPTKLHSDCTYVCIEGPRFSTKAESNMYRTLGADIIGMTVVPEAQLAREAQMCYVSISMVTDYDVWAEKPVTAKEVAATVSQNSETFSAMLYALLNNMPKQRECSCADALQDATL